MNLALCDDDAADLNLLANYCRQYDPALPVHRFSSAGELLEWDAREPFDIVFLDIEMAHPNGYEAAVALSKKECPPIVIFTTQSLRYAVRGYGLALRYLPKPITYEAFASALQLALTRRTPSKISICSDHKTMIFVLSEITYIEAYRHQILVHLLEKPEISLRYSFSAFLRQLPSLWFAQARKSYCVNLNHVMRLEQSSVILTDGSQIPMGRSFKRQFQSQLMQFLKGGDGDVPRD